MSKANEETEVKGTVAGRAAGPVQQLVAAAAKRLGPEPMPEGEPPRCAGGGEALAAKWKHQAAVLRRQRRAMTGQYAKMTKTLWETTAAVLDDCARELLEVIRHAPKPDSAAKRSERSGRRND